MNLKAVSGLSYAERLEQAASSRHKAMEQCFDTNLYSLTSLMGPVDGPEWPSDAAWLAMYREGVSRIMSDGLSDPWVEANRPATGLGLEVFVETPDVLPAADESLLSLADSWMFPMTAEISHTLASYQRLCGKLLAGEPLSLRFNIEHIKDGRGLVGALLHIPESLAQVDTALGPIALVAATLLTTDELRWLSGRGEPGRRELLARLYEQGVGAQSLVARDSVV